MALSESTPRKSRNFLDLDLFSVSLQTKKARIVNPETADTFHVVILISMLKPTFIPKFATPVNIRTWTQFNLITYQVN